MTTEAISQTKQIDEIYCPHCGQIIKKAAVICVKCGIPLRSLNAKSKSVAIVLAIFIGPFAWLYTYKTDAAKFWINIGLSIVTFFAWSIIAWFWVVIEAITRTDEFYSTFDDKLGTK